MFLTDCSGEEVAKAENLRSKMATNLDMARQRVEDLCKGPSIYESNCYIIIEPNYLTMKGLTFKVYTTTKEVGHQICAHNLEAS